jgi:F-type H+-transporting ATPase subunit b
MRRARSIKNAARRCRTFATETTDLALLVAEKVVQRSLNQADNRKFVDEALEALSKSYQR